MTRLLSCLVTAGALLAACQDQKLPMDPATPITPLQTSVAMQLVVIDTIEDYEVIDLGSLGGVYALPADMNEALQIIGYSNMPDNDTHAFLWENGTMRDISPAGAFPVNSAPRDINELGTIVGGTFGVTMRAYIWDRGGAPRLLDTPSGKMSTADAVNDRGLVVGQVFEGGPWMNPRTVVWRHGGKARDIGVLTRPPVVPVAINNRGQVVGQAWASTRSADEVPSHVHPFFWDNGKIKDIGVFGEFPCPSDPAATCGDGWAMAINERGVVVGGAQDNTGATRAFMWDRRGGRRDLGVKLARHNVAVGINGRGQIVGESGELHAFRAERAFLWANGVTTDLGSLGGGMTRVSHNHPINEAGEIVGQSRTPSGDWHAFVWRNGRMIDLGGGPSPSEGAIVTISENGDIVGIHYPRALLWRRIRNTGVVAGR